MEFELKKNILLSSALKFAKNAHKNQFRKSGEPFVVHPENVARRLFELYSNSKLSSSAFLHDTVEDCEEVLIGEIYEKFDREVGFIVDSLNKREKSFHQFPKITFEDKIERFLWAGMRDIRVFLLKLADREDNLKSISFLKKKKQIRMAFETQAIYEPLKKLVGYGNPQINSCEKAEALFWKNLKKEDFMENPKKLKEILINSAFKSFGSELFDLVYLDSSSVIWSINNWETYKHITELKNANEKIKFIMVKGNNEEFYAEFTLLEGIVFDEIRLKPASYTKVI